MGCHSSSTASENTKADAPAKVEGENAVPAQENAEQADKKVEEVSPAANAAVEAEVPKE